MLAPIQCLVLVVFIYPLLNVSIECRSRTLPIYSGMVVEAQLGSPRQSFHLSIDTVSRMTWLYGVGRFETGEIPERNRFNYTQSLTFEMDNREWTYLYNHNSYVSNVGIVFNGTLASDDMELARVNIKHQSFGLVGKSPWLDFGIYGFTESDGRLGLGNQVRTRSEVVIYDDPIQNLFKQNHIEEQQFSIWISDTNAQQTTSEAPRHRIGTLFLGEPDKESLDKGKITYVPVKFRWSFQLDFVQMSMNRDSDVAKVYSPRADALIDTNSEMIAGPRPAIDKIMRHFLIHEDETRTFHQFDFCGKELDDHKHIELVFQVAAERFAIPARDLVIREEKYGKQICRFALQCNLDPNDTSWKLGLPFLKNYPTIFDYTNKRLGLVKLKQI